MAVITKNQTKLNLIIHSAIAVSTTITAILGILYGSGNGQPGDNMIGMGYFKAFTMDSNILNGAASFCILYYILKSLQRREATMPKWAVIFQYMGTASVFLTILTVVFFLAPTTVAEGGSYLEMFSKDMFVYHFMNPILAVFAFSCLQGNYRFEKKDAIWAMLPFAVYAVIYFLNVIVLKNWSDFYGFTFGGNYSMIPPVVIVMFLVTDLLARLLIWLNDRFSTHI